MKLYRIYCTKCGANSPLYTTRVSGRHHDCKQRCRNCEWRKAGHGLRGLCQTCFAGHGATA